MASSLASFKCFDSFNLFLFSRNENNQTLFLLRKKHKTSEFAHFIGNFFNDEPSILISLAKKFVRQTSGLLCSQNFKYFLKEGYTRIDYDDIVVEAQPKAPRPLKTLTPALNDICKLVCESPYFFQDSSNTATYFVEIPMLELERVNELASSRGKSHQFKYFTAEEIFEQKPEQINQKLKGALQQSCELIEYLQKYIVNYEPVEIIESYGIICCEMFLKTYMLHALHFPVFKKHGESWRFYRAFERDLPTDEDLQKLKGLIIPGSSFSAYNPNVDWYQGLFGLIRKVHSQYTTINLLGVCFGAQIIAQALGGKVEKMERDFVDKGETLKLTAEFYELSYVKTALEAGQQLVVAQAHNDHIVDLPPMAKHYGSSETTNVEIFGINNNILGFQGHPDYNEVMIVRSSFKNKNLSGLNYPKYEEACLKSKFPKPLTQEASLKICFNFLKQNPQ